MSISCSVIAHISASHGSGWRRTRSHGRARTARPITGSSAKRSWNSVRSSSTPDREAHPRDPLARRRLRCCARARRHSAGHGHDHRRAVHVQQPHEPVAVPARQPVQRRRPEPERPARPDDLADEDVFNSRRSRWTSIRNEFDDTISPSGPRLLALLGRAAGAARARRPRPSRRPRRSPSRPAPRPGRPDDAAAGGAILDDAALRDHGEAVDDLRLIDFWSRQPRSRDTTARGGRAWCRTRDPSTGR